MSANTTAGRKFPVWLLVSLAAALAVSAVLALGGTGQAQEEQPHDLAVTKKPKQAKMKVGQNFTWTITVTNRGSHTARGVVMTDDLPWFMRYVRSQVTPRDPGGCFPIRNRKGGRCNLQNIRPGQTKTIKLTAKAIEKGRGKNHAHAIATRGEELGQDINPSNNRDSSRHRAIEPRDGGGKKRCGVKAVAGNNGATACVGGVKANARR